MIIYLVPDSGAKPAKLRPILPATLTAEIRALGEWRACRAVFLFGFAKNQRELGDLKIIGQGFLALTEHQLNEAIDPCELQEVHHGEED